MNKSKHWYALIMAGGSGTRLYPLSRENKPKHLRNLLGETTLLQQTYDRMVQIVGESHVFVSTNIKYIDQVASQLPKLPRENIIAEPEKRNTAPAMALSTAYILHKDPEGIIASVHSDHQVLRTDEFVQTFETALKVIESNPNFMLTIGVKPTFAHTGLGYIEKGELFIDTDHSPVFKAKRFVEKPDKETAEEYLRTGNFSWNTGYFVWQAKNFLEEIKEHSPEISLGIKKISLDMGTNDYQLTLSEVFPQLPDEAIDTAVMEKTSKLLLLPGDFDWVDVGSWEVITSLIKDKDSNGNYSEGLHIDMDSKNTIVLSHDPKQLVATIGLEDVIVVTSEDAILIAKAGQSQKVKKVIEEIKKRKLDHLL